MFFFALLFFFQFFEHFSDFFRSIFLQNQNFHGRKFIFPLFIFLFLFSCFLSFFLSSCFCQSDLMAEDKTRHQEKWVKPMVGMVTKVWKGVFCWRVFEHDRRSELMDLNQPGRMEADDFWLGWAAIVCFLWLSELCVTQTARGTPASECLSSYPYVFSLHFYSLYVYPPFPQHLPKSYWKDWATWGGEAEPRGFDGLCRRSKEEDRARNTKNWGKTTQRLGRENKQTGR